MTWIFLCYKVIRRCMQWLQIKNFWSCTCVSIFHTWFAMGREPAIQETDSSWLMHCTVSWSLIRPVERVEWGRRVSYLGPGPSRIPFWEFPGIWFSPNLVFSKFPRFVYFRHFHPGNRQSYHIQMQKCTDYSSWYGPYGRSLLLSWRSLISKIA